MPDTRSVFALTVVTPHGVAWSAEAESILLQTAAGQIEVLAGHVALIAMLEPGELRVIRQGRAEWFAAGEGFATILPSRVTVFADLAEDAEAIVIEATERALQRAEAALAGQARLSEDERSATELLVRECYVKMALAARLRDRFRSAR